MTSSFEKSVKGATKIKAAPPKTKYIEHILIATHAGDAGVGEVFRSLQSRLRDSTWTVVFKSLITVHLMIREGSPDVTLSYLAKHRNMLAISMFSDAQTQGRNIRHYAQYLTERARAFRDTNCDWVRTKESRLEKLSVEKGLLRETETVQHQLTALLKCDVMENEPENEITVTVFRLLVLDLLVLFQVLNQAMINILGHFFEMSKVDAERAMGIYRTFTRQTDYVVQYLSVARQHEHHTRVEVPKLRHAPVNLGRQLEDYLKDPDFEVHRRQYLAEIDAKKSKGSGGGSGSSRAFGAELSGSKNSTSKPSGVSSASGNAKEAASAPDPAPVSKGPDPDLIDFFGSIEQNQTTMAVQANQPLPPQSQMSPWTGQAGFQMQATDQQFQPNTFAAQPTGFQTTQPTGFQTTNPFQQQSFATLGQPLQQQQAFGDLGQQQQQAMPAYTSAVSSFSGYSPQPSFQPSSLAPIPQDSVASFPANGTLSALNLQTGGMQPGGGQQITNPFRQSMLTSTPPTGGSLVSQQPLMGGAQAMGAAQAQSTNPFARPMPQSAASGSPFQSPPPPSGPSLQPVATGTNPFARTGAVGAARPATSSGAMAPQPTGSTNPFRQGAFVNHATGMGWQHNQQPVGGGLDQLETIPVFPRPQASSPWQT